MTDKSMNDKNLRDARLAQALQHMPDAHMQPGAQARLAVLRHAQEAVAGGAGPAGKAPAQTQRWWQTASNTAWGGVLASVLVASFITLMWYGQPVPDVNPEGLPAVSEERATAPAAQKAAVPAAPPIAAKPAPAPEPVLAEKKREVRTPAPPQPVPAARYDKAAEITEPDARVPAPPPPLRAIAAAPAPSLAPPVVAAVPAPATPPVPVALAKAPTTDSAPVAPSKEITATSAVAGVSVAGKMQRNRAELASSTSATVLRDGKTTRLSASRSTALLAVLRGLPYGVADAFLQDATDKPVFTVQSGQGEVWTVSPRRVQFQTVQSSAEATQRYPSTVSTITDAQWQELRTLVRPAP